MTNNGMVALVSTRLEVQHLYDNKAHKNDKIWELVHKKYQEQIDAGNLPRSDSRTVASLKAKFSTLQGVFKLHMNKVARAKQSGASAEDIGERHTHAQHTPPVLALLPSPPFDHWFSACACTLT